MLERIYVYIICLACVGYGCGEQKNEVINVKLNPHEATEINLSEIVDSVKYIRLQADSNSVIGRAHTVIIREKYIYVLDAMQNIVFLFNKNGKYISKLDKVGGGPGEYFYLRGLFVDDTEDFIEVIAQTSTKGYKLLRFSTSSFDLLNEHPFPKILANSCKREGTNYYYATQQIANMVNGKPTNAAIICVNNTAVQKTLFDKNIITGHSGFSPNIESFTENDNGELFVSIMYDNTFYRLKDMISHPVFSVDFGNYGIDNSKGKEPLAEQLKYIAATTGLAFFPVLNINNSDIMTFSYYVRQDANSPMFRNAEFHHYLELKSRNRIFHARRIRNDISSFPEEIHLSTYYWGIAHEAWHKDYLVDVISPANYFLVNENEILGERKKTFEGLGELSAGDNPVIMLMKLKK